MASELPKGGQGRTCVTGWLQSWKSVWGVFGCVGNVQVVQGKGMAPSRPSFVGATLELPSAVSEACCPIETLPSRREASPILSNLVPQTTKRRLNTNHPLALCRFAPSGCRFVPNSGAERAAHEALCSARPLPCPCPGSECPWEGPTFSILAHLLSQHYTIATLQGEETVFLATGVDIPGSAGWLSVQACFGHHFLLALEKENRPPCWPGEIAHRPVRSCDATFSFRALNLLSAASGTSPHDRPTDGPLQSDRRPGIAQPCPRQPANVIQTGMSMTTARSVGLQHFQAAVLMLAEPETAQAYGYQLELCAEGLCGRRRLCWDAPVHSVRDGVQAVLASGDCLAFDADLSRVFAQKGTLAIRVKVSRT
uniref:E3 ubiquitin-protein ligase n=1 Tax=Eptatretus burgeri TaxID=7764 RepID=A0A8C4N690_EPTBU